MKLVRETPLEVGWQPWQLRPPHPSVTVVVKATFQLSAGLSTLHPKQRPLVGAVHQDADLDASVRLDSDLALFKPRAECFLAGTCHAPGGVASSALVTFVVGPVHKHLAVFGDREWSRLGSVGKPASFERMPLSWERSFGGPGHRDNPFGRGLGDVQTPNGPRRLLPNLEDPQHLIAQRSARPTPAGTTPLPRSHPLRASRWGTYDAGWRSTRWPWLPVDFDWEHENAAPADQRITGYFRGNEAIRLENLLPTAPRLETRLPGLRPRACVERANDASVPFEELRLQLDTITVDSDDGVVICLWRAVFEVETEDAADVRTLYVTHETEDVPAAEPAVLAARCDARRSPAAREDDELRGDAPPPSPLAIPARTGSVPTIDRAAVVARLAAGASLAGVDLSGADLSKMDLAGADLRGAILRGANLAGARLDGAVLDGAMLEGADLTDARLAAASLIGADLTRVTAPRAEMSDAVADDAVLDGAVLAEARLSRARCRRASFEGADLGRACLEEAILDAADLDGASLVDAVLRGASLVDARVLGVRGARVVLDECRLGGLRAGGAQLAGASIKKADAPRSRWRRADLTGANLSFTRLERASFEDASLERATLHGVAARFARFQRATLRDAGAVKADLFECNFEGTDLRGADLRGSSLFGAELWRAQTDGLRLDLANVARTKLERR